jgi:hypothetical protein
MKAIQVMLLIIKLIFSVIIHGILTIPYAISYLLYVAEKIIMIFRKTIESFIEYTENELKK